MNLREFPGEQMRRKRAQRDNVMLALRPFRLPGVPVWCQLTRIATRMLDPHDNLPASFKHVADQIAAAYGVEDFRASLGSEQPIKFLYAQEQIPKADHPRVRIELMTREAVK